MNPLQKPVTVILITVFREVEKSFAKGDPAPCGIGREGIIQRSDRGRSLRGKIRRLRSPIFHTVENFGE